MFLFFNSGNKENAIQPGIKASYKRISDYLFNVLNYSNDTKSQTQLYKSQTEHWHAGYKACVPNDRCHSSSTRSIPWKACLQG